MRTLFTASLVGLAILVTGCSEGNTDPRPSQSEAMDFDFTSSERRFLDNVAENMTPDLHHASQADVVTVGHLTCEALDEGASIDDVVQVGVEENMNPYDVGLIIGAAVSEFCPRHTNKVRNFLGSLG